MLRIQHTKSPGQRRPGLQYALVINLTTAKSLDIDVSPMFLARADEVIEYAADNRTRFAACAHDSLWHFSALA
jgi:hypothetical protein